MRESRPGHRERFDFSASRRLRDAGVAFSAALARIAENHLRIIGFPLQSASGPHLDQAMPTLERSTPEALSRERSPTNSEAPRLPDPPDRVVSSITRSSARAPRNRAAALTLLNRVIARGGSSIAPDACDDCRAAPPNLLAEKSRAAQIVEKGPQASGLPAQRDLGAGPEALAYRVGIECAADRLLLAGEAARAAAVIRWRMPKLPIGGGTLIARGLPEGPAVARTLRMIEDRWVEAGFPSGVALERIIRDALNARPS